MIRLAECVAPPVDWVRKKSEKDMVPRGRAQQTMLAVLDLVDPPMDCSLADEHKKDVTLDGLPWELITVVATYVGRDGSRALAQCCRGLAPVGRDPFLWRALCEPLFSQALLDRINGQEAGGSYVDWRHYSMARQCPPRIVPMKMGLCDGQASVPTEIRIGQWIDPAPGRAFAIWRGAAATDGVSNLAPGPVRVQVDIGVYDHAYDRETLKACGGHNRVTIHDYPNGDQWAYCDDGPLAADGETRARRTIWFRCSPRCADRRFAGKLIWQCTWVDRCVDGVNVYRPCQGRFFHAYVVSGQIGWDAATCAAYHDLLAPSDDTNATIGSAIDDLKLERVRPLDPLPDVPSDDPARPWDARGCTATSFGSSWTCLMPHCLVTGAAVFRDTEWAFLSNGSAGSRCALREWFRLLGSVGSCTLDPLSMESVVPYVYAVPWRLEGTNPRWMSDAIVRANRHLCTLVADGADMLITSGIDLLVWTLVETDMVDSHIRGTANDEHARAHKKTRDDALAARLAQGDMCSTIDSVPFDPHASLRAAHLCNIDVPATTWRCASISAIRACFGNVAWSDRLFSKCVFAGASFVGCRFTCCHFMGCVLVDASFVDCVFDRCTLGTMYDEPIDGPIAASLARLGCFRVVSISQL